MRDIVIMLIGVLLMFWGFIGGPANLNEPANTATLIYLLGMLIVIIGMKK